MKTSSWKILVAAIVLSSASALADTAPALPEEVNLTSESWCPGDIVARCEIWEPADRSYKFRQHVVNAANGEFTVIRIDWADKGGILSVVWRPQD